MTNLQRIQKERSECRAAINAIISLESPTDEQDSELETLEKKYKALETRERLAQEAEAEAGNAPVITEETSEGREIRSIADRSSLVPFINEVDRQVVMTGAEAELRSALMGDASMPGTVPLEMLLTPAELREFHKDTLETRAVTPVADAAVTEASQMNIAGRVFGRSVMNFLNIPMVTVPAGVSGYPHMVSGTTVSMQSPSGEQAAVAGVFGGAELGPLRITGSFEFRIEDMYRLKGIENALREDLRDGLSDAMSEQVLNGNGTAPNVQGIRTAIAATPTTDPTGADNFAALTQRFAGLVDGKNCYGVNELRILMSAGTYQHGISLYRGNNAELTAYDWLVQRTAGVEVSSRFPAPASDISHSVVHKTAFPRRSVIMPVWSGFELLVDPYTLAQKGERRMVAVAIYNFKVLDVNSWAHLKVHD